MAKPEKKKGEWTSFFIILAIVGMAVLWAFLPLKVIEVTWSTEQSQMVLLAGQSPGEWIAAESAQWLAESAREANKLVGTLGQSAPDKWLMERVVVSLIWLRLAIHRTFSLLLWSLIGFPLILAAAMDGFLVREIRKHSFVAQSPIRHKIGVRFLIVATWAGLIWLVVPFPAPVLVAPGVIVLVAMAFWMWGSNLQKRI